MEARGNHRRSYNQPLAEQAHIEITTNLLEKKKYFGAPLKTKGHGMNRKAVHL